MSLICGFLRAARTSFIPGASCSARLANTASTAGRATSITWVESPNLRVARSRSPSIVADDTPARAVQPSWLANATDTPKSHAESPMSTTSAPPMRRTPAARTAPVAAASAFDWASVTMTVLEAPRAAAQAASPSPIVRPTISPPAAARFLAT